MLIKLERSVMKLQLQQVEEVRTGEQVKRGNTYVVRIKKVSKEKGLGNEIN